MKTRDLAGIAQQIATAAGLPEEAVKLNEVGWGRYAVEVAGESFSGALDDVLAAALEAAKAVASSAHGPDTDFPPLPH